MIRLLTALILSVALSGCGEVVVFGHVVRENPAKTEAAAAKPATAAPEPAIESAAIAPAAPVLAIDPTATEPAAATPATVAAAPATAGAAVAVTSEPATVAAASEPVAATPSTHATRETSAAATASPTARRLHAVNVTVSPASQAGDASVDAAALADAIRTELRSRNLLDEQNPSSDGTAEVLIESATTHPAVNAVIFGRRPMAGTLTGELHVSSASGERPSSTIVAESRYSIAADGQDKNSLGPLYRRFAVLTADELTGIAANPNRNAVTQSQKP
jgi:hypothetical protein